MSKRKRVKPTKERPAGWLRSRFQSPEFDWTSETSGQSGLTPRKLNNYWRVSSTGNLTRKIGSDILAVVPVVTVWVTMVANRPELRQYIREFKDCEEAQRWLEEIYNAQV